MYNCNILKCQTFTCNGTHWRFLTPDFLFPPSSPVTVVPAAPILQLSTLALIASVNPDSAVAKITWEAPGGISMKSERKPNTGTVAKLPLLQISDGGAYVCLVHPQGDSSRAPFPFNVDVTVDGETGLRERRAVLRSRKHLLLLLLMVRVGISARSSSSSIIYLSILLQQFFKVFTLTDQFQKSTVDLENSSSPPVNIIVATFMYYSSFTPLSPFLLPFSPQLTMWPHSPI